MMYNLPLLKVVKKIISVNTGQFYNIFNILSTIVAPFYIVICIRFCYFCVETLEVTFIHLFLFLFYLFIFFFVILIILLVCMFVNRIPKCVKYKLKNLM